MSDQHADTPATAVVSNAPAAAGSSSAKGTVQWTAVKVLTTCGIFVLAGLVEIGGGWLVWQTVRNKKPWYYITAGFVVLMAYGLIPTLQPEEATFSRVYAVYGGVFIVMSYGWGWLIDHDRPDLGDIIGGCIALAGVCLCWFWPRRASGTSSSAASS